MQIYVVSAPRSEIRFLTGATFRTPPRPPEVKSPLIRLDPGPKEFQFQICLASKRVALLEAPPLILPNPQTNGLTHACEGNRFYHPAPRDGPANAGHSGVDVAAKSTHVPGARPGPGLRHEQRKCVGGFRLTCFHRLTSALLPTLSSRSIKAASFIA